ncbi:AraC family transcriptional regulator [Arcobacter sp. CECT 8985]|uniref:helix-turn-helix domain-containing protein n=1 Tax=Arcobacter sp. CECT 8985 TaxID=1935424 RepID=UPI00100C2A6A|nr:AraC family transcriptional regulator [Arcobacter sp. CECT 8985]RXJ86663.1 AraC family transcriptional regulator [Arcobacter sp. CECT 8985]
MNEIKIFKNDKLPFLELRYIKHIKECEKLHSHNQITITSIKQNSININFKDESILLKPNNFIIINKLVAHSATLQSEAKDGYVLYLDTSFLNSIGLFFNSDYTYKENSLDFENLCQIILDEKVSIIQKEEFVLEFCIKFFSYKKIKEDFKNDICFKIKEYLDENYLEELSLEYISKIFNITQIHLIRVFKKTIHSYILNKKVHKAKELLSKNIPIVDVALQCGFFDQSHLNRNFKRVFQLTPKEYQSNISS